MQSFTAIAFLFKILYAKLYFIYISDTKPILPVNVVEYLAAFEFSTV